MNRDGMTQEEAVEYLNNVREMLYEADPWEIEDIIMDELGLEPDYIFDII